MKFFLTGLTFFFFQQLYSQNCEVAMNSIKGKYDGECKNNLANGKGTATGEDEYTGEFKDGLPDGFGKYVWKNGSWFEGRWKKGVKEGKGVIHIYNSKTDSIVQEGVWKNDKYIGSYGKSYKINSKSLYVDAIVKSTNTTSTNDIIISVESALGGEYSFNGAKERVNLQGEQVPFTAGQIPKAEISNIQLLKGSYTERIDNNESPKKNITTLHIVDYPCRLIISMGISNDIDIELFEPKTWNINITIKKSGKTD